MRSATIRAEMRWYMDSHLTTPEATVALWAKRVPPEDLPTLWRIMRRILATWGDGRPWRAVALRGHGAAHKRKARIAASLAETTTPKRTPSSLPIVPGEAP